MTKLSGKIDERYDFQALLAGTGPIALDFQDGVPVAINGEKMGPAQLVAKMNQIAGSHGVGRIVGTV